MVKQILAVGAGGFIGAISRFGVCRLIQRYHSGPAGTFAVNVIGCLVIGGFMAFLETRQLSSDSVRFFWIVGMLGAFTTFFNFWARDIRVTAKWKSRERLLERRS